MKKGIKIISLLLIFVSVFGISAGAVSNGYTEARMPEIRSRLWELLVEDADEVSAKERVHLIPGGTVFGTRVREKHLTVTDGGECKELASGDKILKVNGCSCETLEELKSLLNSSSGKVILMIERGGKEMSISPTPKLIDGEYKLGAVLREGSAGIGTVTYIVPETMEFGGLGHGIYETGTSRLLEITGGSVTGVVLGAVTRGEAGKPGELTGILTGKTHGKIYKNSDMGLFGEFDAVSEKLDKPIPIAYKNEVRQGEAEILSTLKNGKRMSYSIRISDIDAKSDGTKCFKIEVTDEALLAISGGIVRGMSGSPIIQDGKLVGAVTHVLVADPTEGYGIFIENMLSAANEGALPKVA